MRQFILSTGDYLSKYKIGPLVIPIQLRSLGKAIDTLGLHLAKYQQIQTCKFYADNHSFRNIPLQSSTPNLGQANFVAPNSTVIGKVTLGQKSSVWYGAVLRGDLQAIQIGNNSIIQDLVVIKRQKGEDPIKIGKHVFVGPNCKLGGVVLKDYAFVGMGSNLEDGVTVQSYGIVAAGSHVPAGSVIKSGTIWAGNPAKFLREATSEQREAVHQHLHENCNLASIHSEQTEKTFQQVFTDDSLRKRQSEMNFAENFWEKFQKLGLLDHPVDRTQVEKVMEKNQYILTNERQLTEAQFKSWEPFDQDGIVFPEGWKIYAQDTERYERAKKFFEGPTEFMDRTPPSEIPKNPTPWTKRF